MRSYEMGCATCGHWEVNHSPHPDWAKGTRLRLNCVRPGCTCTQFLPGIERAR